MALKKRGKYYHIEFTAHSGARIRKSTKTTSRKEAALIEAQLIAIHSSNPLAPQSAAPTWQDAAVKWTRETDQKKDHQKDIDKIRWLDPYLGDKYLHEIDRDLIDEIAHIKRKESSESTANRYLALIKSILNRACKEWRWIDSVPYIRLFKEPEHRIRWLSHDEARQLLMELPEHLADMTGFSLATGLRQGNVTQLRWDQVDMENTTAWIHSDQSKSGKSLGVPLNRNALAILRKRSRIHPEFVFTFQGHPVKNCSTKAWYAALERTGIENFRWHDLRHTWATWHVRAGTSLQELQQLGGWSSFEMVLRYAHLATGQLRSSASRIENLALIDSSVDGGPAKID